MAEFKTVPAQFDKFRQTPSPATDASSPTEQGITVWDPEKGCFVIRKEGEPDILLYCEQPTFKATATVVDIPNYIGFS